MTSVLLVTCALFPEGEPGGELLLPGLFAASGVQARWVVWDDPTIAWEAADVVAVRATWDYDGRLAEFLRWARSIGPSLLNGAAAFAWNVDKSYLLTLAAAGVPVVPTLVVEGEEDLPSAIAAHDRAVVKPTVGANGRGVVVFEGADDSPQGLDEGRLGPGPWVVQPLVESVRTEGEHSVFVLGGEPFAAARKLPAPGEIRVNESYGGSSVAADLDPEARELARRTVAAAEAILGSALTYARVDLLRMPEGGLAVGELEVTEPSLYLDVLPGNAEPFVASVLARMGRS